jgi:hypothetical protein
MGHCHESHNILQHHTLLSQNSYTDAA